MFTCGLMGIGRHTEELTGIVFFSHSEPADMLPFLWTDDVPTGTHSGAAS